MLQQCIPEPRRCHKCQAYNHIAKYCRKQKPICSVCSEVHEYNECSHKQDPNKKKCVNCKGAHSAAYKKCPKFIEVRNILKHRAQTGESFRDAKASLASVSIDSPRSAHTDRTVGPVDVVACTRPSTDKRTYMAVVTNTQHQTHTSAEQAHTTAGQTINTKLTSDTNHTNNTTNYSHSPSTAGLPMQRRSLNENLLKFIIRIRLI
jgi:hypothetical protein